MKRISITIPDQFEFSCAIPVLVGHINYGGHLSNDAILQILHEARIRYLGSLDCHEGDIGQGRGIIMVDTAIIYKAECFHGDMVTVMLTCRDREKFGFDMYARLYSHNREREIAQIKTGIVSFNYRKRKVESLPSQFIEKVSQLQKEKIGLDYFSEFEKVDSSMNSTIGPRRILVYGLKKDAWNEIMDALCENDPALRELFVPVLSSNLDSSVMTLLEERASAVENHLADEPEVEQSRLPPLFLLSGLTGDEVTSLMAKAKQIKEFHPLWAMLTSVNKKWTMRQLMDELLKERKTQENS